MAGKFREKFIGDRNFYRIALAIAVPIMVQNGITNFVSLLDNIMVGRLGTAPMAGVSIVNQLVFVYNLCIFGGVAGAGIFTAQYSGRGDDEGIQNTFRYKFWMALIITAGAVILLALAGEDLIRLYLNRETADGGMLEAFESGKIYLKIILLGLPPFMMLQVYASTLRECGETLVPMKAGIAAVFVNLVFNYLLIYGKFGFPELGAAGAAAATVLSRYVEALAVILWTHRHPRQNRYVKGLYQTMRIPLHLVREYFIKGMPLLLNEALWSLGMAVLTQCYSVRGLDVIAALNIANTINNVLSVVFAAMGESVAIIVGQVLGAGDMKKARDTDNKMIAFCVGASFLVALAMLAAAPVFPGFYNTTSAVRATAAGIIVAQAVFIPQNAFLNGTYFTLRAGGKTGITFFFDCVFLWAVSVPTVFLLCRYTVLPPWAVYASMQVGECMKSAIGFILVRRGVWLENIIEE
ncbi:MAG TPA: MATE family efflux transporter [Candidatus Mediterraneibacter surreyensis]|nr:MATE family efflux transporter [Candidatus Mediterraneibacter surreyensis]